MVSIKVGIFVGAVIALPIVFYHFWRFVTPGLVESEKRIFIPALLASIGLFIGGAALAFFLVLPFGLRFFLGFSTESLQPMITINDYFSFAIQVTLMFGLVFETPLVILVLAWLDPAGPDPQEVSPTRDRLDGRDQRDHDTGGRGQHAADAGSAVSPVRDQRHPRRGDREAA